MYPSTYCGSLTISLFECIPPTLSICTTGTSLYVALEGTSACLSRISPFFISPCVCMFPLPPTNHPLSTSGKADKIFSITASPIPSFRPNQLDTVFGFSLTASANFLLLPGKSSVSCPLKPSDSAPLKHSTMPP